MKVALPAGIQIPHDDMKNLRSDPRGELGHVRRSCGNDPRRPAVCSRETATKVFPPGRDPRSARLISACGNRPSSR